MSTRRGLLVVLGTLLFAGRSRAQDSFAPIKPQGSMKDLLNSNGIPFNPDPWFSPGYGIVDGPKKPPECDTPTECGFVRDITTTTAMLCYNEKVYGRDGLLKSPPSAGPVKDCNVTTQLWRCQNCGKMWSEPL
jgi:hypothetical protein